MSTQSHITEVECVELSLQFLKSCTRSESLAKLEGYSYPLCARIFETLCTRREKFHIQTAFILGHNTRRDSEGNAFPIFNGLAVSFHFMIPLSWLLSGLCIYINRLKIYLAGTVFFFQAMNFNLY